MFFPEDSPKTPRPPVPDHPNLPPPRYCEVGHGRFREGCPHCVKALRRSSKTSEGRFHIRIQRFRDAGTPVAAHHFWWFTHNAIAHPLIGVLPIKAAFDFHDFTSRKINGL